MVSIENNYSKPLFSLILLRAVEPAALFYFVALMYKQQALGLFCMVVMAIPGVMVLKPKVLNNSLAIVGVLYVFMATVTAYMIGFKEGTYRSVQFLVLVFAMLGLVKFWHLSTEEVRRKFVRRFIILVIMIFTHMIIYHLITGRMTTWKYLYDTKTVISLVVILLFTYSDAIRMKMGTIGLFLLIGLVGVLVLMSGERKAYLLMGLLFAFSAIPMYYKLFAAVAGGVVLLFFVLTASDNSYVKKQIESSIGLSKQSAGQYDHYRHRDLETIRDLGYHSDLTRKFVNENARRLFRENPLLGLGSGGYRDWALRFYGTDYTAYGIRTNVHGEVNRVPVESGILGILVSSFYFILLLIAVVKRSFFVNLKDRSSKRLFPFFYFVFLVIYCSFEAMDTSMLTLLLSFGLFMSMELIDSHPKLNPFYFGRWYGKER